MTDNDRPTRTPRTDTLESLVGELIESNRVMDASIAALEIDVKAKAAAINAQTRAIRRRQRWEMLATVLLFAAAGLVALDNRNAIDDMQRKFCPILSVTVPRPGDPPPTPGVNGKPSRAQLVAARSTALYRDLGCTD